MSILSLEFLVLMAVLLAGHYCLPVRFRWIGLLAGSMAFYACAGWQGLAYLLAVTLVTWLGGLYMGRCRARRRLRQMRVTRLRRGGVKVPASAG